MIDIHSHVVWGLDDGASSVEDSLIMLRTAAEDGITDIVATPHSNAQYRFQPGLLHGRMEELAAHSKGKPVIHHGCEFQVTSDNIGRLLDAPFTYTIDAGPYLLLEFSGFHIGKHTESILRQLLDAGIVPIVAHPERNPILLRDLDRLASWIELGCLAQVTALSITGGFGSPPRSAAFPPAGPRSRPRGRHRRARPSAPSSGSLGGLQRHPRALRRRICGSPVHGQSARHYPWTSSAGRETGGCRPAQKALVAVLIYGLKSIRISGADI